MSGSRLSLGPEHLEAVLEAGCATLLSLQLRHASETGDSHRTALAREAQSVRSVIAQLHAGRPHTVSPLASGFVLSQSSPGPRRAGRHLGTGEE